MASSSAPAGSAGPFPGVGANERRLYLVNHNHGITVYSGIDGSPDAILDQDWTVALPAFQASHAPGSFTGLEIHCHGKPAKVKLKPHVTRANVRQFGELVGRLLKPGALIEILACEVAAWPVEELWKSFGYQPLKLVDLFEGIEVRHRNMMNPGEFYLGVEYENGDYSKPGRDVAHYLSYHDVIASNGRKNAEIARANRDLGALHDRQMATLRRILGSDFNNVRKLVDKFHAQNEPIQALGPHGAKPADPPPKLAWASLFRIADRIEDYYGRENNGPAFCTELARASNCTVRAAWIPQAQDRTLEGEKNSLIGDWENWVFDFDGRGLKQVHFYLERPVANAPLWNRAAIRPAATGIA